MRSAREILRAAIESFVPWFDRESTDRAHAELQLELARSRAIRAKAKDELMRGSFERAGERLAR